MNFLSKIKEPLFIQILLTLLVFVITFPNIEPDHGTGLDASFKWGYNFLFSNNYQALKEMIFTYGPLGFLRVPLVVGYNFKIAFLFICLSRLLFIFLFFQIGVKKFNVIFNLILATITSYFATFDLILIGVVLSFTIMFIEKKQLWLFLLGVLFALVGFYIKASIGVSCISIIGIGYILWLFLKPPRRQVINSIIAIIAITILVNQLLFSSPFYIFSYLYHSLALSINYTTALSVYPENNWWAIGFFLFTIMAAPIIFKSTRKVYFLLLFPLFAMWKHSMSREDFWHFYQLINFSFLFWGFIVLYSKNTKWVFYVVPLLSVIALYINCKEISPDKEIHFSFSGINRLNEFVFSFNKQEKFYASKSWEKIKVNSIPEEAKTLIDTKTVDIWPWEFTYIAANKLNWKPRKTYQSLHMSGWHDKVAADGFRREIGPEYFLFHYKKDSVGRIFGSVDYKNLLNDAPISSFELFNNYDVKYYDKNIAILEKNEKDNFQKPAIIKEEQVKWNIWINCIETENAITQLKFNSTYTVIGRLKNFLYKDEAYYIDYELKSGKKMTYRFVPSIAKNGLWVSPLVRHINSKFSDERVNRIRFRTSNENYVNEYITIQWEFILKNEKKSNTHPTTIFGFKKDIITIQN